MRVLLACICSLTLLLTHPAIATQNSCSVPKINNQCNSQDVDQSGATGALIPTNALNPIDLFSGNKYLRDVDLYAHPEAPDLEIVRHYNATDTHYGDLGGSWQLSYQARLLIRKAVNDVQVITLQQANGTLRPLSVNNGYLEQLPERSIWHYSNGDKWHFNQAGWLIQIQRQGHDPLVITRHTSGALQHLIDSVHQAKHRLQFTYTQKTSRPLLQQIHSPQGAITYQYEQVPDSTLQRLIKAHYPDHRLIHYHYEAPYQQQNLWAITGKSIQQSGASPIFRVRSWVYDKQGRAIFYMAEQPHQWVRIYFPNRKQPAQTQLHSKNGFTYVNFMAANDNRIQSVSGAGCWACPPPMYRTPNSVQFGDLLTVHHTTPNESQIHKITGDFDGWPNLSLHYNHQGQLTSWQNTLQQPTELFYKNQKAHRLRFANGDEQLVHYNSLQQLSLIEYKNSQQALRTQLFRPSPQHLHIKHPNETEKLIFNAEKNITQRQIHRQLSTPSGLVQWHYQERFIYDDKSPKRLLKHLLPEGGVLHYIWSIDSNALQGIEWENTKGKRLAVIKKIPQGYEYSNGLHQLEQFKGNQHTLLLHSPQSQQLWWQQHLHLSPQGLVTTKQQHLPILHGAATAAKSHHNYFYNQKQQLIITTNHQHSDDYYHWDNSGALAAHNKNILPSVERDRSGLVTHWQHKHKDYILRYNAMRQLDVVYNSTKTVQKNSQNASGFRIYTQHYPQAIQQFFLYDNKKIVAEYSADFSAKLPIHQAHPVSRRYIYLHNKPVGLIDYSLNPEGDLLVMHSDHLGAVHIISDAKQTVRWAATYDSFGAAKKIAGHPDFHFHLRREGQYYDISTDWHHNMLRTYLPEQGHYLEPDPLGPNPTTQLLGYAKQQPLNHTDPWGLILFSFDGTRYDQSSASVIHLLSKAAKEESYYAAGPGNSENVDWDAMVAHSTNTIISKQWQTLLYHLTYAQAQMPTTTVPIDIIGFSRGSAIALHFANQIIKHTQHGLFSHKDRFGNHVQACIQPRFMGLLDTVAQMGILGVKNYQYDFTVSPAWQWVVHGVALHEHRTLFPLHTIGTNSNSQEAALVGSHADLGGGYPLVDDPKFSPLSDVALQWLVWNARAQGMQFNEIELKENTAFAYMHDESYFFELDRIIRNHEATIDQMTPLQSSHPTYGNKARKQTATFIDFNLNNDEQRDSRKAKVDLNAYYRWLDETLNWSPE